MLVPVSTVVGVSVAMADRCALFVVGSEEKFGGEALEGYALSE